MKTFSKAKKFLAFLLTFAMLLSTLASVAVVPASAEVTVWDGTVATAFAGGSGTKDDPYQISNGAELAYMFNSVITTGSTFCNNKYFKLTADIYLNDVTNADWKDNNPTAWLTSKTDNGYRFTGNFDGDGHTVYGMYYSGDASCVGLLPVIDTWNYDVIIENVNVSDSYISTSGDFVGAIAPYAYGNNRRTVHFYNIKVTDSVSLTGSNYVSGIIGSLHQNTKTFCQFSGCAVLADVSSGYALIGNSGTAYVTIVQSYALASYWYPSYNTTSDTTYLISELSAIKGKEAAKAAMPNLDWLRIWNCYTDGTPYPMDYNTNNVTGLVWTGLSAQGYAAGSGTSDDPYIIETPEQLARMVKYSGIENGYFKITRDMYLNDISNANWKTNSPNSWYDRATISNTAFVGNIDGTGHTIHGLYYNGANMFALLPQAQETSISNLRISNSDITSTAGIAAFISFGLVKVTFAKCVVDETVNITGSGDTAGFVAYGKPSVYIDSSASTANITGATNVGAFIGDCWYATSTASDGSTVYPKHVINNSYGIDHPLDAKLGYTSSNCYNTVAETMSFTEGEVVNLGDKALMQGADALKNMPELDFFGTTDTYPVIYQQGTKGTVWSGSIAADYAAGSGTSADPYIIETAEQLVKLVKDTATAGKYFALTADIYLNDINVDLVNNWFNYADTAKNFFQGSFDGNGHTVFGLYYASSNDYSGLFPAIKGTVSIKNIILSNSSITTTASGAGGIVGYAAGTVKFYNCHVTESVTVTSTGATGVGMFIAYSGADATIDTCSVRAAISGVKYAGAFTGDTWSGTVTINNSYSAGTAISGRRTFTGTNNYSTVEDSYGTNVVTAEQMQGAEALNNMPLLTGYYATEGYPVTYNNGAEGEAWSGGVANNYASGNGTEASPYVIDTAEQLAKMLTTVSKGQYYALGADIILSDENTQNNWIDSTNAATFSGKFNGNGYIISGLWYEKTATSGVRAGLIPLADGAYISNVILEDSTLNMTTNSDQATYVGGIVGYITGETNIYSCYVADDVILSNKVADGVETVKTVVGGILGGGQAAFTIDGCAFFGTLDFSEYRYGAVFGDVWGVTDATRIVKYTMVDKYVPSSRWGFSGSNNVSTVAPALIGETPTDVNASFTVAETLKGEEGYAAVEKANWNSRYFATENYPVLTLLGRRFYDANGDRVCNAVDLTVLRKYLIKSSNLGNGDINGDGKANLKDLVFLKKKVAELDTESYKLVWSDEFEGASLDETKWNTSQTRMADTEELAQSNLSSVRNVADGNLQLTAMTNTYYNAESESYFEQHKYMTTGSVTTENKMSYQYGYLEISAKVPYKEGCWPSFWLRSHNSTGKQTDPSFEVEVDVFEVFGNKTAMASNLHQQNMGGSSYNTNAAEINAAEVHTFADASNLSNEYHTYGFEWTPEKMAIYVDGELQCEWLLDEESLESYGLQADASGFDTTMNILFNNHLFTSSSEYQAGTVIEDYEGNLPAEYDIDYVRLYQKNDGVSKLILGE